MNKIEFENYEQRIDNINALLNKNNIKDLNEALEICLNHHVDPIKKVKEIQPISFDDAGWAYTVGAAIAIKNNIKKFIISLFIA